MRWKKKNIDLNNKSKHWFLEQVKKKYFKNVGGEGKHKTQQIIRRKHHSKLKNKTHRCKFLL